MQTCKHHGHPAACLHRQYSHRHPSQASAGRPTWAGLVGLRCLASTLSVGPVMVTMGRPLSRNLGAVCDGAGQGVSIGHVCFWHPFCCGAGCSRAQMQGSIPRWQTHCDQLQERGWACLHADATWQDG